MDGKAPTRSGKQQVANQRVIWKMVLLLTLCLLQATGELKGPRRVSGVPGGLVTIRCYYEPLSINRHQRKYWCRLKPPAWTCHTIVSTNHYIDLRYHGRVALEDFPRSGWFEIRLSELTLDDMGHYRCGLGNKNNVLFFDMDLNVCAGQLDKLMKRRFPSAANKCPSSTVPLATSVATDLHVGPFGRASSGASRRNQGTSPPAGQGIGWDRVALTPRTSRTTASTKGRQIAGTTGIVASGTGSWGEDSIRTTVPVPESPVSNIRSVHSATEGLSLWGSRSTIAGGTMSRERERNTTATKASKSRERTERVTATPETSWKAIGAHRPSRLVSEKWAQEVLQEAVSVSKPKILTTIEGTTPAASLQASVSTDTEMASVEGGTAEDPSAGHGGSQATPSRKLVEGKGSSEKSAITEEKNVSWILTKVSLMLFPLTVVALVLLQRKLQGKTNSRETGRAAAPAILIQVTRSMEPGFQADRRPHVEKTSPDGSPPIHVSLPVSERETGFCGIEGQAATERPGSHTMALTLSHPSSTCMEGK